jgi:hypothetical protein
MRPVDHSECYFDDCVHKRDEVLALQKKRDEDKEQAYYEAKRAKRAREVRFHEEEGEAPEFVNSARREDPVAWRKRKVQLLEGELLEARIDQVNAGDPMPLQELRNTVGDALRLAEHKNQQYRDAWRKQGYMGNLSRILSKTARLEAMLWNDPEDEVGREEAAEAVEPIRETLLDLINLAGFMAVNCSEGNRWGKRDQR